MWTLPFWRRAWRVGRGSLIIVAALAVLPLLPFFDRPYVLTWLVYALWFAAATVGFDLSAGWINIVNLGYAAFIGTGAYVAALVSIHANLPPLLCLPTGAATGALLGLALGGVVLRFRGIYAALASWFLSLALAGVTSNLTSVTRGNIGLSTNVLYVTSSNQPYFYTALIILVLIIAVIVLLVSSRLGLAFRAVGTNLEAARASGVVPARLRLLNFTISCGCGGLAGAFYAGYFGVLTPSIMKIGLTVQLLVAAMIGGSGSITGALAGGLLVALLYQALQGTLQNLPGLGDFVFGLVLIAIVVLYPGGLARAASELRRAAGHLRRRMSRKVTPGQVLERGIRGERMSEVEEASRFRGAN